jgi:aspartate carbamoyltransferase catalytic subunit
MKTKLESFLSQPLNDELLDVRGFDRPRLLIESVAEDLVPLLDLAHRPVVSARQYSRTQLLQLCRLAARYETQPQLISRPLTGKILVSAFYEPSTRTRLSFESAWHRLGGDIMSITDPATTGIAKGESLFDVGEMLNHYGDLVVLRDSDGDAIYQMLEALRIPIVNAGNGIDEHPTQAMADIYALLKWRPAMAQPEAVPAGERVRIGIVGVPGRMRTVRSLLYFLAHFAAAIDEVVIVTDSDEPFSEGQREDLEATGLSLRVVGELDGELPGMDVVYINAIAWVGDSFEAHGARYRLDASSALKPGAIVLHPLARGVELDRSLDGTPHNWYFAQARGAVFVRMALLAAILKIYN